MGKQLPRRLLTHLQILYALKVWQLSLTNGGKVLIRSYHSAKDFESALSCQRNRLLRRKMRLYFSFESAVISVEINYRHIKLDIIFNLTRDWPSGVTLPTNALPKCNHIQCRHWDYIWIQLVSFTYHCIFHSTDIVVGSYGLNTACIKLQLPFHNTAKMIFFLSIVGTQLHFQIQPVLSRTEH